MNIKPCVIGLGYVGLPVLINLSKKFKTFGFDINKKRVIDLSRGLDSTKEFKKKELSLINKKNLTHSIKDIRECNIFIVCVPTPINIKKKPDLSPLISACKMLSKILKKKNIIIFESTVYPGTTKDVCIPLLEKYSRLKLKKKEFSVCYSPERVNPGDRKHSLNKINKIIAVPNNEILSIVKKVYNNLSKKLIISKNIEEAETSKVIENIQRDLNISLMNEVYIFCEELNINFDNVYKLASTKWNFGKYRPGLVGGHCLPVDPYYFSYIANKHNIKTSVTLAGRGINEYMRRYIIKKIKINLRKNSFNFKKDNIYFAGLTYKKNVSDLRNSQAFKIFSYFRNYNNRVFGIDPYIDKNLKIGIADLNYIKKKNIGCVIVLVKHDEFNNLSKKLKKNIKILSFFD